MSLATSAEKQKISCLIWQGNEWKGADLSMLEICNFIVTNVEKTPLSLDYFYIGVIFSFIISGLFCVSFMLNFDVKCYVMFHVMSKLLNCVKCFRFCIKTTHPWKSRACSAATTHCLTKTNKTCSSKGTIFSST